ncbi:MAG: SPOR domain-containing protein [Amphiplicatus sp.]
MSAQHAEAESYEDEYEEYDEFDDDEDSERGLSGLVVLLMGVVMLGAFASVVWIAYQQGIKTANADGAGANPPYVAADPEPLKIENQTASAAVGNDREVYDSLDGNNGDPVEVLTQGPEEPVTRSSADPIGDIASQTASTAGVTDDAVADRIATLAAEDETLSEQPARSEPVVPAPSRPATSPTQTAAAKPAVSAPAASPGAALSGTHVVQVGAVGSDAEAATMWSRMEGKLGDYLSGKSMDVEVADLGAKGVFHRVRIGPFASRDEAATYCEGLKSRGQDCLVKAK